MKQDGWKIDLDARPRLGGQVVGNAGVAAASAGMAGEEGGEEPTEPPIGEIRSTRVKQWSTSSFMTASAGLILLAMVRGAGATPRGPSLLSRDISALRDDTQYTCGLFTNGTYLPVDFAKPHDAGFWVQVFCIPLLVLLSGLLAGLTLGMMSLDQTQLHVLTISGTARQKAFASRVEPLRRNGHLLLTTLLLANVIVNETLPIIFESTVGGGVIAVVLSTVLIVIFAEILPQAICSRHGLAIGAFMAWPVRILIACLWIICYPVSKFLDYILGPHHGIIYRRAELKELINLHAVMGTLGGDLNRDTVTIMGGAIEMQDKVVGEAMTPIDRVFMLPIDAKLDYATMAEIMRSGHSRIPIYEMTEYEPPIGSALLSVRRKKPALRQGKRIMGALLVKSLVLLDPEDAVPVRDIPINPLPSVREDQPLNEQLNVFQEGRSHMAIVVPRPPLAESIARSSIQNVRINMKSHEDSPPLHSYNREQVLPRDAILPQEAAEKYLDSSNREPMGIITLEDVIEELLGEEILDESDLVNELKTPMPLLPGMPGYANEVALVRHDVPGSDRVTRDVFVKKPSGGHARLGVRRSMSTPGSPARRHSLDGHDAASDGTGFSAEPALAVMSRDEGEDPDAAASRAPVRSLSMISEKTMDREETTVSNASEPFDEKIEAPLAEPHRSARVDFDMGLQVQDSEKVQNDALTRQVPEEASRAPSLHRANVLHTALNFLSTGLSSSTTSVGSRPGTVSNSGSSTPTMQGQKQGAGAVAAQDLMGSGGTDGLDVGGTPASDRRGRAPREGPNRFKSPVVAAALAEGRVPVRSNVSSNASRPLGTSHMPQRPSSVSGPRISTTSGDSASHTLASPGSGHASPRSPLGAGSALARQDSDSGSMTSSDTNERARPGDSSEHDGHDPLLSTGHSQGVRRTTVKRASSR